MPETPEIELPPPRGEPMNPAQKLTVLSVAIGVAFSVGTLLWTVFGAQRDIQDLKRDVASHATRISTVEERALSNTRVAEEAGNVARGLATKVDQMDANGTRASQRGIYEESSFSKQTAAQVATLQAANAETQKALMEIMGTVKETKANVDWLIRQQPTAKNHP